MPVICLVRSLCTFSIQVIFFLKHGAHTTLPNFKIGLTNDLKSGTIISFVLNLNVNRKARSYRSAILLAFFESHLYAAQIVGPYQ